MSAPRIGATGVATTKGDLYVVNASGDLERVTVGATGQVLYADAALPLGLGWLNPLASVFDPIDYSGDFDNYRMRTIGGGGAAFNHTAYVPADFASLVSFSVRFLPQGTTAGRTLTVATHYALPGENDLTHTGAAAVLYDAVGSRVTDVDIAAAVPALAANQVVGVRITNTNGPAISVFGTVMVYRRKAA